MKNDGTGTPTNRKIKGQNRAVLWLAARKKTQANVFAKLAQDRKVDERAWW